MKFAIFALLGLVSFLLTLVGALAATGNLTQEGIDLLLKRGPEPAVETVRTPDSLDPLLKTMRDKEERIASREKELEERARRLALRERDLEETRGQLEQAYTQFSSQLDTVNSQQTQEYSQRLEETANTLGSMKPQNAADILAGWPPSDAARLLLGMEDRKRSKILDSMDPDQAASVIRALQEGPATN
ncbi:MAG: hypothetical protein GY851_36640 [bacterium]|nr:hypothetical protein [bacterium]